jgi:hypothetical protein
MPAGSNLRPGGLEGWRAVSNGGVAPGCMLFAPRAVRVSVRSPAPGSGVAVRFCCQPVTPTRDGAMVDLRRRPAHRDRRTVACHGDCRQMRGVQEDVDPTRTGAPGRIRTCDPRIRSPPLYPAELRAPGVTILASRARGRAKERATRMPSTVGRDDLRRSPRGRLRLLLRSGRAATRLTRDTDAQHRDGHPAWTARPATGPRSRTAPSPAPSTWPRSRAR